jgi:hypothetical protein
VVRANWLDALNYVTGRGARTLNDYARDTDPFTKIGVQAIAVDVGDVGHTLVVGPTGAGKSVLLALMALQFRRYPRSQVFAFDFGGSIRAAALAMGGDWHDLGGAISEDVADPVALQPLARIDDAGERAWAAEWVGAILSREGVTVTPEVKELVWSALTSLASALVGERTLTGLSVLLQSGAFKRALQPYCVGGPWGRLLDAEAERLGEAHVQAFETEGLIGGGAAPAVLAYLFHRVEASQPGEEPDRPAVFVAAGHRAVDHPYPAASQSGAAHRLRHQPDRSGVRAFLSADLFRFHLIAAAHRRCPDALAEFAGRLPGCAAGPGRRGAGLGYVARRDQRARVIEPVGGGHSSGQHR